MDLLALIAIQQTALDQLTSAQEDPYEVSSTLITITYSGPESFAASKMAAWPSWTREPNPPCDGFVPAAKWSRPLPGACPYRHSRHVEMMMKALRLALMLLAFLCFCFCIYYDDRKPAASASRSFRPNLLALGLAFGCWPTSAMHSFQSRELRFPIQERPTGQASAQQF